MKTTTHYFNLKYATLVALAMLLANGSQAATLFENFDNPSALVSNENSSMSTITYSTGAWLCLVNKMTSVDYFNGIGGIRFRGIPGKNMVEMKFNKNGAGVVSFNYCSYSNQSGGKLILQQSINDGVNWTNAGSEITVPAFIGTFLTYSALINYNGNIRFRILATETSNANTKINVDDFEITDYNIDQTALPVITPGTSVYETAQNVTITCSTPDVTIYYTTDGTVPTTLSTVYLSPISVTQSKTIKAIAVSAGKENSRIETVIINIPIEVNSISSLYNFLPTSGINLQYYKFTGDAIITYYYSTTITSASVSNITKYMYFQDNSAGVLLKDNYKKLQNTYKQGDKFNNIILQVENVNGVPQILPYSDFNISSSDNIVLPTLITLDNVSTKPYQLVQINNVFFDGADGTKAFSANNSYFLKEGNTVSTFPVRIPNYLTTEPDYYGSKIPTTGRNIVGIVTKAETAFTDFSLFVRSAADLNVQLSAVKDLKLNNISVSNGKIHFETSSVEKVNVFSVSGQLVKSINSSIGRNSIALNKGIYIIRIGEKAVKVTIY